MFQQLREHCEGGYDRKSFVPKVIAENVENVSTTQKIAKDSSSMSQISNAQKIALLRESDPFFSLQIMDYLQEIADKNWSIPTSFMAALLQITPSTLLKYQQYSFASFTIIITSPPNRKKRNYQPAKTLEDSPVGLIEPKTILWRVDANNS